MSNEAASELSPMPGLTFRKGKREANVHEVKGGVVYYGMYLDGEEFPTGLYRASLAEWDRLASQALVHGAEVFTKVRPKKGAAQ
ncbi:hypothetical protein [Methyloversatilis discipulorum]|uniref:hypothetical protein n=1 Tax=Methyloversatilis discipulorum TaxID=1119528 RepID=UPI001A3F70F3|nr:hypothetical protein [Methyloversatilis discipulorum]MBL8469683.1 hypothetical protein [Methyloversatilis discipulorum]